MLPLGHASAGYFMALGIASLFHLSQNDPQTQWLLWVGFVFGAIPDIDMFVAFGKTRSWVIENGTQSHRTYVTHTPFFWLLIAGIAGLITRDPILFCIILLAPLSHLILDSIEDEIRWFWPFSRKPFCMIQNRERLAIPREPFFGYWRKFLVWYIRTRTITAVLEVVLVVLFVYAAMRG